MVKLTKKGVYMKKLLLSAFCALLMTGCTVNVEDETLSTMANPNPKILTLFSSKSVATDKVWVGTFQLAFNDMKNNIIKKDVIFENTEPTKDLIGLNKEEFNSSMLNESSYYTSYGETSPEAKEKIKKGIKEKFNETSDVLDLADWERGVGKYYAYAMLKKEFEYNVAFDILEKASFNNSKKQYNYFGINSDTNEKVYKNVDVLFYNDEDDFAVQLLTKSNDIVLLYRTQENADFKTLYEEMNKKASDYKGRRHFSEDDTLKIPNIKIDLIKRYQELCNRKIVGTDLVFSEALETLKLELDNKGGKVKSEAIIMTKNDMVMAPVALQPMHLNFDKTFVMFLIDAGKADPYLALRVEDLEKFQTEK